MRLLIATGIYPPDHGGPARFVPALAAAAAERGWQVRVLTLADTPGVHAWVDPGGFPVVSLPRGLARGRRILLALRYLRLGLSKSDVLFANGLFEESAIATRLARKPWVAKVVGDPIWERATNSGCTSAGVAEFQRQPLTASLRLQRDVLSRSLKTANGVVTPSSELADFAVGWGLRKPLTIPNGVSVEPLIEEPRHVDVVAVCRLVPWKGLDVLIRACAQQRLTLDVVGDGPLRQDLERLVAHLGAEHLVCFRGAVPPDQVRGIVSRARVFALNSSYEGMSFALLEARERGLPAVVGDNPGNQAVVRDGVDGFLVDPRSVGDLGAALARVVRDPALAARLGSEARKDIEARYSIDASTGSTLRLLEQAAHG